MLAAKKIKGSLHIICGPMFSGKSEELIRRIRRAKIARQSISVYKHSLDDRTSIEHIASHNGTTIEAKHTHDANFILQDAQESAIIGIDEVQFYSHDIITTITQLIATGKKVIVAGLDTDFRGIPFGPIPTLLAIADTVLKLQAICTICGNDAHHSQRLIDKKPARFHDPVVLIGAQETYQARCRNCFEIDHRPTNWNEYAQ